MRPLALLESPLRGSWKSRTWWHCLKLSFRWRGSWQTWRFGFGIDKQALAAFGTSWPRALPKPSRNFALAVTNLTFSRPSSWGRFCLKSWGCLLKDENGVFYQCGCVKPFGPYHAIIPKILEFRSLTKLKSTYVDGLLKQIAKDGRIHSSLNQTGTVTGRISSSSRICRISPFEASWEAAFGKCLCRQRNAH